MNKELQKLIDESKNKSYSKLTDKQLAQYDSLEYRKAIAKAGCVTNSTERGIKHIKKIQKIGCVLGGLKQGHIQGKKNAESGMISALGKKMSKFNNRIRTCPHCGITTRGVGYVRWHGDNCKYKNGGE